VRSHLDVGDVVQVRSDGGSAAARKYAGRKGQVMMRGPGLDRIVVDVQLEENDFDTNRQRREAGASDILSDRRPSLKVSCLNSAGSPASTSALPFEES
jgi:hypothetical protein